MLAPIYSVFWVLLYISNEILNVEVLDNANRWTMEAIWSNFASE